MQHVWIIFCLFTSVASKLCQLERNVLEAAEVSSRVKCTPTSTKQNGEYLLFNPGTVCIFTCRHNSYRFKHRCNQNGQWDSIPKITNCDAAKPVQPSCPDPSVKWSNWLWNCSHGFGSNDKCQGSCNFSRIIPIEITCIHGAWVTEDDSIDLGQDCQQPCPSERPCEGYVFDPSVSHAELDCFNRPEKVCLLNCEYGFVPTHTEIVPCQTVRKTPINLTCERPVSVLVGGFSPLLRPLDTVEVYHPSIDVRVNIPKLPFPIPSEMVGLWYDGNLIVCGESQITLCYKLIRSDDDAFEWQANAEVSYFIRSAMVSMTRPKDEWLLYVTGGTGVLGTSILAYDYTVDITENPEAFHPALHDRHCSFSRNRNIITIGEIEISTSNICTKKYTTLFLGKNHFYVSPSNKLNEVWTTENHGLHLSSPSCLQLGDENILVMDTADPDELYVFQVDSFKIITLDLPERLESGSKLTLLDGQVHILGGSKVVKKLVIENEVVSIVNVSKSLKDERSNFVAIEVPLSFFF